ncbi:MAG TPA: phosphate ABC transporter permease [Blastocatellia bacterium]|nr:phosphate ABC transporter permease [Blastocatellia bacterium]
MNLTPPAGTDSPVVPVPPGPSAQTAPHQKALDPLSHPLVVIEPSKSRAGLNLRELFSYHELLYFLTWRDIKVRYKQTVLGVLWAILQPLFMMLIFALFFGRLVGVRSDGIPYPLFAYAGLLPWTFFSTAATASGNSIVNSANLITKVYFPRLIVPAAAVAAALVDFAITFIVLAVLMVYYHVSLSWALLMLPVLIVLLTVLALAFGILMAALNVKYRDIKFALPFLIQLWFFASPIIYPTSLVPPRWRWILALNPMTGIIEGFRTSLFGHSGFDWQAIATSTVITLVLLVYATWLFKRMEKTFADIV